jgi:hypothetical protein
MNQVCRYDMLNDITAKLCAKEQKHLLLTNIGIVAMYFHKQCSTK